MFGRPKKLREIPSDVIPNIQLETENIIDANDKLMISLYCLGELKEVEWHLKLLKEGSKKYIVPQNKEYLEMMQKQLVVCYENIMSAKLRPPNGRPLLYTDYPEGYEG